MKFTEFRDTTQSTNQQGFAKAQNRLEKGVAEAKADPLGAWIAHKNGTEARKFKTREGAKKYVASHAGFTVSSSEAFHDTYRKKKVQEVKKFRTNYGWAGGSKEPRSAHAKQVATKRKEYDDKGLGKFEPTDNMVGTARITKDVAEGSTDLASLKAKASKISDKIDAIVQDGGRVGLDDPLSIQLKSIRAKIQQAKKQGVAEDSLNEFAPGEHGIPPFTVYVGDTLIDKFASYDEAQEEVEYQRGLDPRWFHDQWKIVNGIGETVWEYDVGEKSDDMRRQHKIQFIPRDNKDVAEGGLQYYTGVKKHGKEYMTKAAQAARNGASQKELGALKDKYSKAFKEDHGPEHPEAPVNYGEYDREGDMAKDDLRTIDDAAEELYSILQADENLPEWVQSKITKAVDYIDTARDYMKAQKYEPGMAEGIFTKGPAIDPIIGKQINSIINRLHYHAKQTKDEYLRGTVQELFAILRNTGGTYSPPGSRDVAEGGAKYKVKSIGHDARGNYYISPSTGKKVYKKAKVGDHENPKTGEHKGVTEATESRIDDGWFKQGAFKTSKKAAPVKYQLAQQSGTVNTLEGPVRYEAGHYIMTGPKGEQYPISPEKFNTLYDDNGDGTSTPKKISKLAKLADHDGVLHTSWGDLQYTKGNDYIVRHGAGDYGAVKKDIFAQTYDNQARKLGIDEEKFNITFKAKTPAGKSFEKKYDIDAADKYAAFDKIKKRLGAQYDALNYPTFLQGKKKAKMPPSVKTAMKNLNKGKVS